MMEWQNEVWIAISGLVSGISSYVFGVKRTKKELEGMTLDNVEKSIEIYRVIIDDMKQNIQELLNKVDHLEKMVEELKKENENLKKRL